MNGRLAFRCVRDDFFQFLRFSSVYTPQRTSKEGIGEGEVRAYKVIENTFVKLPFLGTALPELLVVVVETFPVGAEFVEAALVYIFDPAGKV
jgi:hypothetical protein